MTLRNYRKIPIWENRRRRLLLQAFRDLVTTYDGQVFHEPTLGETADTQESEQTRSAINRILDDVDRAIDCAGLITTVTWTPPPMVGGNIQHVPVFTNLFNLHNYHVPLQTVIDFVDRAIGVYKGDQSAAWIRTCNPLFWLGVVLDSIVRLPFQLARSVGFNTSQFEDSWIGRVTKLAGALLAIAVAIVTLMQAFGWWGPQQMQNADQRAWLSPSSDTQPQLLDPLAEGNVVRVRLFFKNAGKTPALNVKHKTTALFTNKIPEIGSQFVNDTAVSQRRRLASRRLHLLPFA